MVYNGVYWCILVYTSLHANAITNNEQLERLELQGLRYLVSAK